MNRDIFISYSRRDQEFVERLASDLHEKVAGVWFDQASIQVGQKWRDQIMDGIRACRVFILVLSPDAAESQYVREEVTKALELGKTIIPIIYRPAKLSRELEVLVSETQYLDLQSGSYTENFQKLVDGLVAAGAAPQIETSSPRLIRRPLKTDWRSVFRKIPGWGCAWSVGWALFTVIILIILLVLALTNGSENNTSLSEFILTMSTITGASSLGGFSGGLIAGLITMLVLRAYAGSISWKHMQPSIRIWSLSGLLGIILSGLLTAAMIGLGILTSESVDCTNLEFKECLSQTLGGLVGYIFTVLLVFLLVATVIWFITGVFAGRLAVRHIRRLEPGITGRQGWGVAAGWGCGAIAAVLICLLALLLVSSLAS